jgi:hypothetical protein
MASKKYDDDDDDHCDDDQEEGVENMWKWNLSPPLPITLSLTESCLHFISYFWRTLRMCEDEHCTQIKSVSIFFTT